MFVQFLEPHTADIIQGCYHPPHFRWFLQPFPAWCAFFIVPVFSTLSSLANLQPMHGPELPIMVMGGTAFTSRMVTGVPFLVPSGLSQLGGITANGNGIDIGGAIAALGYMFGTRKNAAVFLF
ncbi:hypothetical protein B0H14DRAFT_3084059 [Mycena olivaceomarginata]|nr:hypothetical protein B0H14DRAFT_3084059 [Mycena olivaceomarginata]